MNPQQRNFVIGSVFLVFLLALLFKVWTSSDSATEPVPNVENEMPAPDDSRRETLPEQAQVVSATPVTAESGELTAGSGDSGASAKKALQIRAALKLYLSSIYAAEKSFHAESGRYSTDFDVIGWMPQDSRLLGKAGFLNPYQAPADDFLDQPDKYSTDLVVEASQKYEDPEASLFYEESAQSVNLQALSSFCQYGCTADSNHFEAIAAANLDEDEELDVWRINDQKELTHVFDDLQNAPPADDKPPQTQ